MNNAPGWMDYAALIFGAVGALGFFTWRFDRWEKHLKDRLRDADLRQDITNRLHDSARERYYHTLDDILSWVEKIFGRNGSFHAFERCLMLAYLYPILFTAIAWLLWNNHSPTGFPLFPDITDHWDRLSKFTLLICAILFLIWFIQFVLKEDGAFPIRLRKKLYTVSQWVEFHPEVAHWLIILTSAIVIIIVIAIVATTAVAVVLVILIVTFTATAGIVIATIAIVSVPAISIVGILADIIVSDVEFLAHIIFFYLLLPLANAVADWGSLDVTRRFLTHMQKTQPDSWGLIVHMLLDLLCGLFALICLLGLLVGLLEFWGMVSPETLPLDWRSYWASALDQPSQATAFWLMCFTTFLPTFVHIIWALSIWQAQKSLYTRQALEQITTYGPNYSDGRLGTITRLIARGRLSGALRALLLWGPFMVLPMAVLIWMLWHSVLAV